MRQEPTKEETISIKNQSDELCKGIGRKRLKLEVVSSLKDQVTHVNVTTIDLDTKPAGKIHSSSKYEIEEKNKNRTTDANDHLEELASSIRPIVSTSEVIIFHILSLAEL